MKRRMLKVSIILMFVIAILAILNNGTYAASTMDLNITDIRPYTSSKYTVTAQDATVQPVVKIIKNNGTTYVHDDALYCVRSGLGFGNSATINGLNANHRLDNDITYTEKYNLKTQSTEVKSYYATEIGFAIRDTEYNSILWIIDNMYLPEHPDSAAMKEKLLRKAEIVNSELTDDDIEFVQQMALWYFTNYDERMAQDKNSLAYINTLSNATKINDENLSETKARQIDTLYEYFIGEATVHANDYVTSKEITPVKPQVDVNTASKTIQRKDGFVIVGPFSITETAGNVDYELQLNIKDAQGKIIPEKQEDVPVVFVVNNPDDMVQSKDTVKDTVGQGDFYLKISEDLWGTDYDLTDINIEAICNYEKIYKTIATLWLADDADQQPVIKVDKEEVKEFDLALRKNIIKVNGTELINTKEPAIDTSKLATGTTADYNHRKNPVEVKTGDKVTYKISIYNEGQIKGAVTEIIDYLPTGLIFNPTDNPDLIEYKTNYSTSELLGKKYAYTYNATTRELHILPLDTNTFIFELDSFDGNTLDSDSLNIVCEVTAVKGIADKVLTNIATMKYQATEVGYENTPDRDSSSDPSNLNLPTTSTDLENYKGNSDNKSDLSDKDYFYKGQEDDDDFDKVVIKGAPFDLSLRKFITKVNGVAVKSRTPKIDTSKLNTIDPTTGEKITTAKYTHSKDPVNVRKGDIVTYKIRVYNEGGLDGYATKVADYLPEGLGYIMDYKENTNNFWVPTTDNTTTTIDLVGANGLYTTESAVKNLSLSDFDGNRITSLSDVKIVAGKAKISSTKLEDEIIKAYNENTTATDVDTSDLWQQSTVGTSGLYYRELEITCIVLADNSFNGTLRNIAEIEANKVIDEEGNTINAGDRDSIPDNVDTVNYNPPADNSTYQEDDDDYEPLELRFFDLALRKFITAVNEDDVTTRIPQVKLNENGKIEYEHDKTPVYVANSDIVTYTIRVYNEGTILGYAMEVSDDIPDGLEFLPNHAINKQYQWVMLDKDGNETQDPSKAVEIRTRYLENTLLQPFDASKPISDTAPLNPDYADVKVAFQVVEQNITQSDRIIVNKAQITEDKAVDEDGNELDIDDEDSIPDQWNEGEDDQDIEKIYVKYFDLALLKWVTKTIVTVDGKTTTTETGFTPYDDPEPIAKVVIDKKKLSKTTVKFVYNIIIMNQGEIAGYATEITDYIPAGLKFVQEDNPIWTKTDDGKITTRALENTLLQPGESATVEVTFTWENGADNLGLKTNIAEISEDYNDKGSEDIDSTPDNVITPNYDDQQEDDDDKALVILEIKTGGTASYIWLGLISLTIVSLGIMLIKKFVL